jgi:hypothetical protein
MESAIPSSFVHAGKTYPMSVSLGLARVAIFEHASAGEPLAVGVLGSLETFGHTPAH